jgi:hypothetical protein
VSLDATLRALRLVDKTVARRVSGSPLGAIKPNRRPKGGSGIASWSIPDSEVATDSVPGSDENGGSSEAPAPANNALD